MSEKKKTNVTDDEVNDLIPHDVHAPQDVNDLLITIRTQGLDVLESDPRRSIADQRSVDCEAGRDICQLLATLLDEAS
jgi:RNA polymerase primary sigma factor